MRRLFPAMISAIIAGLLVPVLAGCNGTAGINVTKGSGKLQTETHEVSGVTAVELNTSGQLTIIQGETESLTIETDDNILPLLSNEVTGGKLQLSTKPNASFNPTSLKYTVTVKNLAELVTNGSGDTTASALNGDNFMVTLNGSGKIMLTTVTLTGRETINLNGSGDITVAALSAEALTLKSTGSGDTTLSGTASQIDAELNGSGDLQAAGLMSKAAKVTVIGSGSANVQVSDTLNATINGSGSINYSGDATVTTSDNGSGDVNKVD